MDQQNQLLGVPSHRRSVNQTAVLRAVWLVLVLLLAGLVITAVPFRYQMLVDDVYNLGEALAEVGIPLPFFAGYFVFWEILLIVGSLLVALLIVWRRADEPFAMLVAINLTLNGILPPLMDGLSLLDPRLTWLVVGLRVSDLVCLMAVVCLFPNGRFQPKWTRWLLISWVIVLGVAHAIKPDILADTAILPNIRSLADGAYLLVGGGWFMAAIGGQVYRFRRLATSEEQQQTKWVLFGLILMILSSLMSILLAITVPVFRDDALGRVVFVLVMGALILLSALLPPITIALAMLRYRLWQVDIYINRTVLYGGLTVLITAVYVLLVGGMGALAANESGSLIGLVLATAIVLVGIRPVYRKWQTAMNRYAPVHRPRSLPTPHGEDRRQLEASRPWRLLLAIFLFLLVAGSAAGFVALNLSVCRAYSSLSPLDGIVGPAGGLGFATVGLVIVNRRPANPIGWLCLVGGLGLGLGGLLEPYIDCALGGQIAPPGLALTVWFSYTILPLPTILSIFIFLPLWFPNGRFLTGRWRTFSRILLALIAIFTLAVAITPDFRQDNSVGFNYPLDNPLGLPWLPPRWGSVFPSLLNLLFIFGSLAAFTSMIVRLKRSRGDERQQMKFFAYWTAAVIIQLVVFELTVARLAPSLLHTAWYDPVLFAYNLVLILVFLGFPLIIGVAIFKYRLYDIDIIINRTLVYGGLSLGIVAIYVLVVGALGAVFQSQGSFLFALLATGLIAVLFQPVRERLQRSVNRLMFGERDDPYAVLSKLGAQLQTTATPEEMLQSVVETIAATLKLPYVAIELIDKQGRLDGASTGRAVAETIELPLRYQKEAVGYLVVSPRSPGESFTDREQQLLADMAAQTGAMANSVRLTAALQRSAAALQQAREELVLTREEERRRIRRDLHDGLGPTLASQTFTMDAILDFLENDPQQATHLLLGLKTQNQETVAEIRRLVYELRPPALDELGLLGALKAHVAQFDDAQGPRVRITARPDPLPSLSAGVEAAAYRIVLEAITNVVRHAEAGRCDARLQVAENGRSHLRIEVSDDGIGLPAEIHAGVGLSSMRERAEELGGTCRIAAGENGGTRVTADLPLTVRSRWSR